MHDWGSSAEWSLHAGSDDNNSGPGASVIDEVRRRGRIGGGGSAGGVPTGIRALMLAVLEDGIRAYLYSTNAVRDEAEFWVRSRRQSGPFSFVTVCSTLGLEPSAVRRALLRMRGSAPSHGTNARSRPNSRRAGRITKTGRPPKR
jgi:hypothetical protein